MFVTFEVLRRGDVCYTIIAVSTPSHLSSSTTKFYERISNIIPFMNTYFFLFWNPSKNCDLLHGLMNITCVKVT